MRWANWMMILGMATSGPIAAQTCFTDIPSTAPNARYSEVDEGLAVLDAATDLIWQRCAAGRSWDGTDCIGDAMQFTWQEALVYAHQQNATSNQGWRLPNVKELSTLTERQCVRPAINTGYFPATPPDDFWTSTPSVDDPTRAWVVAFFNASNSIKQKDRAIFVRLVRTRMD